MTLERRGSPRQALGRDVLLYTEEGKPIGACHLCDVSATGARLSASARVLAKLPEEFILVLAKQAKVHRRCRTVWRNQDEVGVRFSKGSGVKTRSPGAASSAASVARSQATAG